MEMNRDLIGMLLMLIINLGVSYLILRMIYNTSKNKMNKPLFVIGVIVFYLTIISNVVYSYYFGWYLVPEIQPLERFLDNITLSLQFLSYIMIMHSQKDKLKEIIEELR